MSGRQIAEFDGSTGVLKKEYVHGASGLVATIEPTAINSNGTRYVTSDVLGSPRLVTSSGGGVVSRHDYKPFGEEIGAGIGDRSTSIGFSIADGVRQKFTGKERDNETGFDYFLARYYSSTHGRFTSPDSVAGSASNPHTLNLYAYVLNNPLRYVDPTGHFAAPWTIDPLDWIFGDNPSEWMLTSQQQTPAPQQPTSPPSQPQQEPKPVDSQRATLPESEKPTCHMCYGQVVTTVIIDQMNQPGARVRNVKGTEVLTVGVDLRITFLDQDGEPIVGTVSESVEPSVIQATGPVPLNEGRGSDLVSNSLGSVPQTPSEQQAAIQKLNETFTTDQTVTFTVVPTSGPPATVTQKRSLTNTTPGAPKIAGVINGYTFKMEPPKIKVP